jgi:hypothetical protein
MESVGSPSEGVVRRRTAPQLVRVACSPRNTSERPSWAPLGMQSIHAIE